MVPYRMYSILLSLNTSTHQPAFSEKVSYHNSLIQDEVWPKYRYRQMGLRVLVLSYLNENDNAQATLVLHLSPQILTRRTGPVVVLRPKTREIGTGLYCVKIPVSSYQPTVRLHYRRRIREGGLCKSLRGIFGPLKGGDLSYCMAFEGGYFM